MKITFLQRVQYESEGRGQGPVYEAGETVDLREDLARRWINRGVAEPAKPAPKPAAPSAPATASVAPAAPIKPDGKA